MPFIIQQSFRNFQVQFRSFTTTIFLFSSFLCRGNEWYRRLIRSNRPLYRACPKHTKLLVSKAIVQAVEQQGGRFLDRDKSNGKWKKVAYKRAVDKTSQGLRERDRDEDASGDEDEENGTDPVTVPESFSGRNANVNLNELASVAIQHANSGIVRAPSSHLSAPQLGGAMSSLGNFSAQYNPMMARQPMGAMMSPDMQQQQQRAMSAALKQQRMEEFNDDMNPLPPGLAMRQSSMFRMLKHVQLLPGVSDVGQPGRQFTEHRGQPSNLSGDGKQKRKRSLIDDDDEHGVTRSFAGQPAQSSQMLQSRFNTQGWNHAALTSSASQPPMLQSGISSQLLQNFGTPAFTSFQSLPSLGGNQLRPQQMNNAQYGQSQLLQQMSQTSQTQLTNQMQMQQQMSQGQIPMNQALQQQLKQAQLQLQLSQGQFPSQVPLSQQLSQGQMMNHLQLQQQMNSNQLQLMSQLQRQSSGGLSRLSSGQNMPAPPLGVPRLPSQMAYQSIGPAGMNKPVGLQDDPANAPSFTRLKTQVSDWLKNSFWPVGSNPPSAAQQLGLRQQQHQTGGEAGQDDKKELSRQLAVNAATAITQMIPPPNPGAMQDRKGSKRQKFGSDNGSNMVERQTPIITTVPPPGPQRSIQINTIPPISAKNKHTNSNLKQAPHTETEVEAAAMTSEVERSVSASLLTLASTPTGLFKGLSSLFGNPGTSVSVESRSIRPDTEERSTSPDFPAVGLKKSKKSLLDDDDDEPPEEARLRTVPW